MPTARACGRRSTRRPRRRADVLETLHKATVQALKSAPVQEAFKKQMIKAVPNASIADAKAWNERDRALEEAHRDGEGRAAGIGRAAHPGLADGHREAWVEGWKADRRARASA